MRHRHRWHRAQGAWSPATWYVRRSLHRRIFYLLGGSILFTGLVMMGIFHFTTERGGPGYSHELAQAKVFVAGQFARAWAAPVERDAVARSLARDLDVDLTLRDAAHGELGRYGEARCDRPQATLPIERDGETVGHVDVCVDRGHGAHPGRFFLTLAVFGVMLWGASGRLARRLTRPYSELARVASEIGAGKLSSRYELDCRGMDEARVLADSINDMATRIEKQMADQRELLAAVSHEIRTPLARIRLLAELMRGHDAGERAEANKALDDLDREVIEIDALVSELLASSRVDFAALSVHTLDAGDVAARALERAGLPASLLRVAAKGTRFDADATLVARALANLLANAKTHGGGALALVVRDGTSPAPPERGQHQDEDRESGPHVVFEVEDGGPGFSAGEEAKVFESFYQRPGGQPRTEKGALGLGLTLVKRIAVAHGGTAFAENREGGGARVGIALPLVRKV